jgi:hypothetical protein
VDVGDDSGVSEVDEHIIYELAVNRTGMEDGEVGVFNAGGVEVRVREGASV